jgi:hypothetical protein
MTSGHFSPDKIALPEAIAALLESAEGSAERSCHDERRGGMGWETWRQHAPMNGVGPGGHPA